MRTARIGLGRLLRRINRLALGAAVGLVAVVVLLTSFALGLAALVETSRAQARVLAENASAALAFGDTKTATELLRSLRNVPDILVVSLHGHGGVLFASYARAGSPAQPGDLMSRGLLLRPSFIEVRQPVDAAPGVEGRLVLRVGLSGLYRQMRGRSSPRCWRCCSR